MNNKLLKYAFIKGYIINNNLSEYLDTANKNLTLLTSEDEIILDEVARKYELKTYYFKDKEILPRVNSVLGFLKNIYPSTILDVGSGRGVFLFPFMCEFENCDVTSIDILPWRVAMMNNIKTGGVDNLNSYLMDITKCDLADNSFDCVTLLEVLEHIENVSDAVKNAVRMSKRYIVVSVPSKEDDNPGHIHLLTKDILTSIFNECGVSNLKFSGVNGHLILIARK